MARLPRLTVAGHPHHVIQRGNNRQPIFVDDEDYRHFLGLLHEHARREKVAVHAYVLMPNHVHLLLTPETEQGLPALMQALGRRYVQYFNRRHHRTGTLWEGRYRATLVDSEAYLLTCMAYIDLNPVRAGLVGRPADYRWSSHGHYVGLQQAPGLSVHPLIWQLGNTPFAREAAYGALVQHGIEQARERAVTESLLKGWALGRPEFVEQLQKQTQRRLSPSKAGRPRRSSTAD
jgi:putative transposase